METIAITKITIATVIPAICKTTIWANTIAIISLKATLKNHHTNSYPLRT